MEFRFLGPFDVVDADRTIPIGGGRQRALLAILALHASEVVPVGRLIDDLWPEHPPDSALNTVQAYVSRLRKALGGDGDGRATELIVFQHGGYTLDVSEEQIDANRFVRLVEAGERRADSGNAMEAAAVLREALDLWRGAALPDFAHEPFAQAEIARLEELASESDRGPNRSGSSPAAATPRSYPSSRLSSPSTRVESGSGSS